MSDKTLLINNPEIVGFDRTSGRPLCGAMRLTPCGLEVWRSAPVNLAGLVVGPPGGHYCRLVPYGTKICFSVSRLRSGRFDVAVLTGSTRRSWPFKQKADALRFVGQMLRAYLWARLPQYSKEDRVIGCVNFNILEAIHSKHDRPVEKTPPFSLRWSGWS